jgi:hypothetical protein
VRAGDAQGAAKIAIAAIAEAAPTPMRDKGARVTTNLVRLCRETNHPNAADKIYAEAIRVFGKSVMEAAAATVAPPKSRLPSTCEQCGAPVRPDEIEIVNDIPACMYCGTVLQA